MGIFNGGAKDQAYNIKFTIMDGEPDIEVDPEIQLMLTRPFNFYGSQVNVAKERAEKIL